MVRFSCDLDYEELIAKWDEHTSPARFAGSDDNMDLIFVSKRKNNSVKLVRRARSSREPFSTVFRGKIKKCGDKSEIVGFFTKTFFDYAFVTLLIGLVFYIRSVIIERAEQLTSINAILAVVIVGSLLLLINTRAAKRRYSDFICRITGFDPELFLSRKEKNEKKNQSK